MKKNSKHKKNSSSKFVLSASFDDGEILAQRRSHPGKQEYVLQSSITDIPFEEYVVVSAAMPVATQHSVDVNLFYSPSQTYSAPPEINPAIYSRVSDKEKLSLLDNIAIQNNAAAKAPSPATSSSFEYADSIEEATTSAPVTEDDFVKDMQAILNGQKVFDPVKKIAVEKQALTPPQSRGSSDRPEPLPASENQHAIFDQIARSMEFAKAYDLGSIDLEKRFSDFDKILDIPKTIPKEQTYKTSEAKAVVDNEDFIKDLDAIARTANANSSGVNTMHEQYLSTAKQSIPPDTNLTDPGWPPRPVNLRPFTSQERAQLFGTFPYVPDPSTFNGDGIRVTNDWRAQNIIAVPIPQLIGKMMGSQRIANGIIYFHRTGATALQNLWNAWQAAGLLESIINFQGGYAARYIRNSQGRTPRPLSNHAWGTAFDINAPWNGFGAQPALAGQLGSVRGLVSLANQHGFFWGGHFRGSLDGMHFELGKTMN